MRITGNRDSFLNCLQKVSATAQVGNINPMLSNVLLQANTGTINIIATDMETQVRAPCEAKANKKFDATVSAKRFQNILQRLDTTSEIYFEYQEGKGEPFVNISAGKTKYKLRTEPADNFPQLGAKSQFKTLITLNADVLMRCLKRVQFASATNSHRLHLNGVLLEGSIDGLRVVATNGHRMAVQTINKDKSAEKVQLILPKKSVSELIRNLASEGETSVEIKIGDSKKSDSITRFSASTFELTSNYITENFPDYRAVIPRNNDKEVCIDRATLLAALQRVAVVGDPDETVVMNIGKNLLRLECTNKENEVGNDEIDVKYNGEKLEIGFNVNYLTSMLQVVEEDEFKIQITDPSSSVLIEPQAKGAADFQYVLMPIRL